MFEESLVEMRAEKDRGRLLGSSEADSSRSGVEDGIDVGKEGIPDEHGVAQARSVRVLTDERADAVLRARRGLAEVERLGVDGPVLATEAKGDRRDRAARDRPVALVVVAISDRHVLCAGHVPVDSSDVVVGAIGQGRSGVDDGGLALEASDFLVVDEDAVDADGPVGLLADGRPVDGAGVVVRVDAAEKELGARVSESEGEDGGNLLLVDQGF
jgi:hypothetical protein